MSLTISFKNMDRCDILINSANLKIIKIINKYVVSSADVYLTFSYDHKVYVASLDFKTGLNRPFNLKVESYSNFSNLDKVCEKLEKKLRRIKDKKQKIQSCTSRNVSSINLQNNDFDFDSIDADQLLSEEKIKEHNSKILKCV